MARAHSLHGDVNYSLSPTTKPPLPDLHDSKWTPWLMPLCFSSRSQATRLFLIISRKKLKSSRDLCHNKRRGKTGFLTGNVMSAKPRE